MHSFSFCCGKAWEARLVGKPWGLKEMNRMNPWPSLTQGGLKQLFSPFAQWILIPFLPREIPSVVLGPAAAASPWNLVEMQILRSTPDRLKGKLRLGPSDLCFNKPCRLLRCSLRLENTWVSHSSWLLSRPSSASVQAFVNTDLRCWSIPSQLSPHLGSQPLQSVFHITLSLFNEMPISSCYQWSVQHSRGSSSFPLYSAYPQGVAPGNA